MDSPVQQAGQIEHRGPAHKHERCQAAEGIAAMRLVAGLPSQTALIRLQGRGIPCKLPMHKGCSASYGSPAVPGGSPGPPPSRAQTLVRVALLRQLLNKAYSQKWAL